MLRIDVAFGNTRRRVGDPPRLEAVEPEFWKSVDGKLFRERVRPWSIEAMALHVAAHARQPSRHDPVRIKPVPTKLVSAKACPASHHAYRRNHGSPSSASCACLEHVPACEGCRGECRAPQLCETKCVKRLSCPGLTRTRNTNCRTRKA